MRTHTKLFLVLVLLSALLTACNGSTGTPVEESQPQSDAESSGSADCPAVSDENALFIFPDIEAMTLLTPVDGGGRRPLLSWESVQGADYYGVVLFAENDQPYWAWRGDESAIYVGGLTGEPPPPEIAVGAIVAPCMTWTTTAYNAEGVPIAAGGPRLISP